jgi:cytoplasmic iron level regulating protein YaaA (DUF328/UPF0246 family)
MLILLSPAKTLDYDSPVPAAVARTVTQPLFTEQAVQLIEVLRKKKPSQVATLMALSDKLAALNVARYASWQPDATPANSKPAVLAFDGDVYAGLQARSLSTADLHWAQQHVVLLSGLYGVLRPLDLLQPYRLEMGTALKTRRGGSLYAFWGDRIAEALNERQAGEAEPVVLNLASQEYARAALRPSLKARVVEAVFEDWHGGRYKVISFFAKKARGLMARHAIQARAKGVPDLLSFKAEGYAHDAAASQPQRLVFRRKITA